MLDKIKKATRSWLFLVLMGLLVLSFAVWGVGDIFRGGVSNEVAKVGSDTIYAQDFEQRFRNEVQRLGEESGGLIDTAQARAFGVDQQVLSGMINRSALGQAANDLGLAISNTTLNKIIVSNPAFRGTLGQFSMDTYEELLALNNLTPGQYEQGLRQDLKSEQLIDAIIAGSMVPRKMAEAFYSYANEKREIEYLLVPPEQAGTITPPTEEEINAYYQDNASLFRAPEFRTFSYLLIDVESLKDEVDVDEATVREVYDFNPDRFAEPELRTVQIIPFLTEDDAIAAKEDLESGLSFEGVAEARGFTIDEITQEKAQGFEILDQRVAAVAFEIEPNVVSQPVNGELGWAILRVTETQPKVQKSFEDARAEIEDELKTEGARELLDDLYNRADDELSGGATVGEAASRLGTQAVTVTAVDRSGNDKFGSRAPGLPYDAGAILAQAFTQEIGEEGELLDSRTDGFFSLRVDAITESQIKPLGEVRSDVIEAVTKQKREDALKEITQSIVERANAGAAFSELAGEIGRSVLKPQAPLSRDTSGETFSSTLVGKLFAERKGTFVEGPVGFGESRMVAVTRKIIEPDLAAEKDQVDALHDELKNRTASDTADMYIAALRNELGVLTYPESIDAALGGPQF